MKGQQENYNSYMEKHIGKHVPYPDVSNTRYGSHGEAAATIIVYHNQFLTFMEFVRLGKDNSQVYTNIEKNFVNALQDTPTLTELCVLALYNVAVSRPFMKYVRLNGNILLMESFFQKKANFLKSIAENPSLWMGDTEAYKTASLDGKEWDGWTLDVLGAVKKLSSTLPDLNDAIVAFLEGARETFVDRFSDEFKKGGLQAQPSSARWQHCK